MPVLVKQYSKTNALEVHQKWIIPAEYPTDNTVDTTADNTADNTVVNLPRPKYGLGK